MNMTSTQTLAPELEADEFDVGTCAACGELPVGHDNFTCNGRGHASKVNDCGTCDEWDTGCPHMDY